MIVFFQSFALVCVIVGLATGSQPVLGATGGALGATLGIGIRLIRKPPANE
jgi:hypothetical protein